MTAKKEIKDYAEDRFFEVFGQVDDFENEYSMLMEELASCRTQKAIDECLEILLEVYKKHYEDFMVEPKAWNKK